MGEIADLMLDGAFCEACCTPMGDGQSPGYPRYHKRCSPHQHRAPSAKVACPICARKVKPAGLADHQRDVHGALAPFTAAQQEAGGHEVGP